MYKKITMTAVLILFSAANLFSLDAAVDESTNNPPFHLDWAIDGMLLAASAGLNGTIFYLDTCKGFNHSEFDGNILSPSQVNSFDRILMTSYSPGIDKLGTGLSLASMLTPAALLVCPTDQWLTIGVMYAETITFAYGLKELGKLCVNRARPYMYFEGFPQEAVEDYDWNNSFPSGHTTLAFAGASFTTCVFSEYFPDSKWKIPVIASSYIVASGTAACRIASGDHFLTDVLAGALAGTVSGLLIPSLHSLNINMQKRSIGKSQEISVQAIPMGAVLNLKF